MKLACKRVPTNGNDSMIGLPTPEIHRVGGDESSICASQTRSSVPFVELRNTLPSHVDIISPFVDQLMHFISRFRRADKFEIELASREAIANAIVHGNQEDPYKRVYVRCRCTADGGVSITVQDEGDGFESDTVPDPTALENLFRGSGRGIYLIKTLMDEVRFEQRGTVVHMCKKAIARPDIDRETR
jgi:serine/threonine-protein kinase RsbW